ncbi:hypothetical protein G4B88_024945 [Cannabis sativa]|uniref:Uncharacterized protein n=1 Tax=Cannabis sativa TaxID=3483 RepID=A0A7J6G9E5_CANSA|nr:hypothetical protein G4B88_024945 [Cannabis sativa]
MRSVDNNGLNKCSGVLVVSSLWIEYMVAREIATASDIPLWCHLLPPSTPHLHQISQGETRQSAVPFELAPEFYMSRRVKADFGTSDACQNHPGLIETSHSAGTQSCPSGSPLLEYLLKK